jgi:hypothetical protein
VRVGGGDGSLSDVVSQSWRPSGLDYAFICCFGYLGPCELCLSASQEEVWGLYVYIHTSSVPMSIVMNLAPGGLMMRLD